MLVGSSDENGHRIYGDGIGQLALPLSAITMAFWRSHNRYLRPEPFRAYVCSRGTGAHTSEQTGDVDSTRYRTRYNVTSAGREDGMCSELDVEG